MATIYAEQDVNPSQLCYEMDKAALCCVGPYPEDQIVEIDGESITVKAGSFKITADDFDEKSLIAAVAAHTADDNWVDPTRVSSPRSTAAEKLAAVGLTVDDLKALLSQ